MTTPEPPTLRHWFMIATLGLVWGATFMFIEIALGGLPPFWLAAWRLTLGAALMLVIWRIMGGRYRIGTDPRARWPYVLICGVISTVVPFTLLSWGQLHVVSSFAGVSMATIPLMVLPLAHFFVPGDQLTRRKSLGFGLGFAGTLLLIGPQAVASSGSDLENWGRLACFGAAACYAISSIILRNCPPIDPIAMATLLLAVGAVIGVPLAWAMEGPPTLPATEPLVALLILAFIPTAAANYLRVLVVRSAGPTFMTLTNFQVPLWSLAFGALILGEPLPKTLLVALVLILSGLTLSQWSSLRRLFGARM
ncbi:DMT family transporter [Tropicimonas sp. S265A]|uniref:DMT family transporter n=1 Tax=Tropicimonas sp. S265A TaxID=3415134 RepID=UPI003C7ED645